MKQTTFADFDLIEPVRKALEAAGYQHPTPIQALAIPPLIAGRDLLGSAQTGTGKTAAFAIPLLHRMGSQNRKAVPRAPRALVLAPTRELALQIAQSFSTYGKFLHLRHTTVVGGVGQSPQVRALARGVHVLIATPGRLLDLMGQGHVRLDELEAFVLDEVDRMLDMGFLPDLKRIVAQLPEKRQSLFFSATMPPNIVQLADQLLRDPVDVRIEVASKAADAIDQSVYFVSRTDKTSLLAQILQEQGVCQTLVFTRTKHGAERLAQALGRRRLKAAAIHGDKSQAARLRALSDFRAFKVDVLVATDVASRGIDVAGITHVVNFDIPHEPESYVHRIGRTGRAGATGRAISLCDSGERRHWQAIEKMLGVRVRVDARPAPTLQSEPAAAEGSRRQEEPAKSPSVRQEKPKRSPPHSEAAKPRAAKPGAGISGASKPIAGSRGAANRGPAQQGAARPNSGKYKAGESNEVKPNRGKPSGALPQRDQPSAALLESRPIDATSVVPLSATSLSPRRPAPSSEARTELPVTVPSTTTLAASCYVATPLGTSSVTATTVAMAPLPGNIASAAPTTLPAGRKKRRPGRRERAAARERAALSSTALGAV